jgi:hypothetical protein
MILELEKVIRVPKRKTMKPRCVKTAPGFRGLDDRKNRFVSDANNAKRMKKRKRKKLKFLITPEITNGRLERKANRNGGSILRNTVPGVLAE